MNIIVKIEKLILFIRTCLYCIDVLDVIFSREPLYLAVDLHLCGPENLVGEN